MALAASALLVTAACTSDGGSKSKRDFSSYVALGDSSVAGPGISPADTRSGICARSKKNWPALLAKLLDTDKLKDVSCSGAVSDDILRSRTSLGADRKAQIDSLSNDTDLVTISIGGNNEGLFSKVILACLAGNFASDKNCAAFIDTKLDGILTRTTDAVAKTLERIKAKAPNARVVLVGYLRLLPAADGCTMPGLTAARVSPAVSAWNALDQAIEAAANRADVEFVSLAQDSVGHEPCNTGTAWVNGLKSVPGDGAFLHPNKNGMRAVAKIVAEHLNG